MRQDQLVGFALLFGFLASSVGLAIALGVAWGLSWAGVLLMAGALFVDSR